MVRITEGIRADCHGGFEQETASRHSSATESLLASDEKQGGGSSATHELNHASASLNNRVHVPTRDEILAAYRNPSSNKPPTHALVVALGLVALLIFAWATTEVSPACPCRSGTLAQSGTQLQLLSLGTRYGRGGPRMQVILMISDGMGARQ